MGVFTTVGAMSWSSPRWRAIGSVERATPRGRLRCRRAVAVVGSLLVMAGTAAGCGGSEHTSPDAGSDAAVETSADVGVSNISGDQTQLMDAAVSVRAQRCRAIPDVGVGLIIESGRVLTAAHVVAGATSITVTNGDRQVPGEVLAFDPTQDLAVIGVASDLGSPIPLAEVGSESLSSATGHIAVFRDGEMEVRTATIVRRVAVTTEDIYRSGRHRRLGYEIDVPIESGDSGSVVVVDGDAVAVIWGRARHDPRRVWATDAIRSASLLIEQLASGEIDDAIDLTRCS